MAAIWVGLVFLLLAVGFLATGEYRVGGGMMFAATVNFGIAGYRYLVNKQQEAAQWAEHQRQRELRRLEREQRLERERETGK